MENSVLLNNPIVLIGYVIVLALCVLSSVKKSRWIMSIISVLLFAAVTAYALLAGASLYETGAAAALFFAVRLLPLEKEGEE